MIYNYDIKLQPIPKEYKIVILFWAEWHEDSIPDGPMDTVLKALSDSNNNNELIRFGRINAEDNSEYTNLFGVTSVPTFVLLQQNHILYEIMEGTENVSLITQSVRRLIDITNNNNNETTVTAGLNQVETTSTASNNGMINMKDNNNNPDIILKLRIEQLIKSSYVMLFIKGTPEQPKCGFSRQVITILQEDNIPFHSFDILQDEAVRQGLKEYSNWPTYPQIYVNSELIGGLDILKELKDDDNLKEQWNIPDNIMMDTTEAVTNKTNNIEQRCNELIRQDYVMLFMKGLPSAPRCGFSSRIVDILNEMNVPYGSYDILQDENVRDTLKIISNWPTYPQLYVNGELIGGLDIVEELYDDGVLQDTLKG